MISVGKLFIFSVQIFWLYPDPQCYNNVNFDSELKTLAHLPENWTPCCFPRQWESLFDIRTTKIGIYKEWNFGHIRVQTKANETGAILTHGNKTKSTEFCKTEGRLFFEDCPKDMTKCLVPPFLGNPSCVGPSTGFYLRNYVKTSNYSIELWNFDKKIHELYIKRFEYKFHRKYDLCKLIYYKESFGQLSDPKLTCEMLSNKEIYYKPKENGFSFNFNYSMEDGYTKCRLF